ncbi:MAG: tetratricopeptide repeat protein [Sphingomonas sp.]|nr:tetratricopeptide repeat protein [Sphingomonas sp.]
MKSTIKMLGIAFAASTALATATAAEAQREGYGSTAPQQTPRGEQQQKQEKAPKGSATVTIGNQKIKISAAFAKAYQELVTAVDGNDVANIPAKVAAANAAAQTKEERYLASQAQLKAAVATKNDAQIGTALESLIASGMLDQAQQANAWLNLGKTRYNQKQFPAAIAAFEQVQKLEPGNTEIIPLLAQARSVGGNPNEAVATIRQAIAQQSANGGKAPEDMYKRAISLAYKNKLAVTPELSRQWAVAYPTPANWSDAIRIYRNLSNTDEAATLDLYRLTRAAKAMKDDGDYDRYAYLALSKGYPGEAKLVLEEGVAAGVVDVSKTPFKEEMAQAKAKSAGEAATLDAAATRGLSAPTAKAAVTNGDLLYGYGQFAKAADLYRAALKKPGADAGLINLHLGMALARAGDKAGATAALSAVTGPRAEIAKYWLAFLQSQA